MSVLYIPKKTNPWEALMPNLANSIIQGMVQNKLAQPRIEAQERREDLRYKRGLEAKRAEYLRGREDKLKDAGFEEIDPKFAPDYNALGTPVRRVGEKVFINKNPEPGFKEKQQLAEQRATRGRLETELLRRGRPAKPPEDYTIGGVRYSGATNRPIAGSEKPPATAMAAFLRKNPDAKIEEIKKFAQGLKTPTETPAQKRAANLKVKKEFAVWKTDFESKLPQKKQGSLTPNQQRVLDQSVASAGSMILNNAESPAVKPHITYVNKYLSKEPYIFTWTTEKGMFGDKGKAVQVDLPEGTTAADIKFTMRQEGKRLNQVLKELGLLE